MFPITVSLLQSANQQKTSLEFFFPKRTSLGLFYQRQVHVTVQSRSWPNQQLLPAADDRSDEIAQNLEAAPIFTVV